MDNATKGNTMKIKTGEFYQVMAPSWSRPYIAKVTKVIRDNKKTGGLGLVYYRFVEAGTLRLIGTTTHRPGRMSEKGFSEYVERADEFEKTGPGQLVAPKGRPASTTRKANAIRRSVEGQ